MEILNRLCLVAKKNCNWNRLETAECPLQTYSCLNTLHLPWFCLRSNRHSLLICFFLRREKEGDKKEKKEIEKKKGDKKRKKKIEKKRREKMSKSIKYTHPYTLSILPFIVIKILWMHIKHTPRECKQKKCWKQWALVGYLLSMPNEG